MHTHAHTLMGWGCSFRLSFLRSRSHSVSVCYLVQALFAPFLATNSTLTSLDLGSVLGGCGRMGREGGQGPEVRRARRPERPAPHAALSPFRAALCFFVPCFSPPRSCDQSGNQVDSYAAAAFGAALADNSSLTALSLAGYEVSARHVRVYLSLSKRPQLAFRRPGRVLTLLVSDVLLLRLLLMQDGKRMRSEGCVALMRGLAHNQTLIR